MGDLIYLEDRRSGRSRPVTASSPSFFFDVGCPQSYLTAERIERVLGKVEWVPTGAEWLHAERSPRELEAMREQAHTRARALRLPLVWPERFPSRATCALRAASRACELGAGSSFVLAAMRLHFCGGFDLDDPETLAEAAAAGGLSLEECLETAGDADRDRGLRAVAEGLRDRGLHELPVIRVGRRWFEGERGLAAAAAALLSESSAHVRPLAPAS
ncbi:MAG TPA: DsbA family protein [Solirubrobacteraceae bacterium]|jgi:2-hydroxychromene-2-carboxylate isomerase